MPRAVLRAEPPDQRAIRHDAARQILLSQFALPVLGELFQGDDSLMKSTSEPWTGSPEPQWMRKYIRMPSGCDRKKSGQFWDGFQTTGTEPDGFQIPGRNPAASGINPAGFQTVLGFDTA